LAGQSHTDSSVWSRFYTNPHLLTHWQVKRLYHIGK